MQFVTICLIGIAVLVSPCTYDTDPREPSAGAAIIAKAYSPQGSTELAAEEIQ